MVFNAIGRIIGYFFFIIALAFLLTNTVLFVGFLVYDEIGNYQTTGELTTMSVTELEWVEILQFHPEYIFVYMVVGIFVLLRYILWSFNEFRTAVRESKDKARKSKELEIARKHNHKQKLLEYRQEEQELEQLEQNLDLQTKEDVKALLETGSDDEEVKTEPTEEPSEEESTPTKPKPQKKVKVVTARKRSTVDKDLNPNQDEPPVESKVERMIREKEERKRKEEKLRRQARKRNKERERKQREMNEKYQSEEEDDKDFKIKGVFNRKD